MYAIDIQTKSFFDESKDITVKEYFNITETEWNVMALDTSFLDSFARVTHISDTKGNDDYSTEELSEIFGLVRKIVEVAHGVRVGDSFVKTDENLKEFKGSPQYNQLIVNMVKDPRVMIDLFLGSLPKTISSELSKELGKKSNVSTNVESDAKTNSSSTSGDYDAYREWLKNQSSNSEK